jgi:hypothetical protein
LYRSIPDDYRMAGLNACRDFCGDCRPYTGNRELSLFGGALGATVTVASILGTGIAAALSVGASFALNKLYGQEASEARSVNQSVNGQAGDSVSFSYLWPSEDRRRGIL